MPPDAFVITYAAHTSACTFLLDAEGICRRIVINTSSRRRDSARTASECVGGQYVASLDGATAGCLVEMPRVGAAMLFARVDERGRVALVRTGPVTRFEARSAYDPFADASVKTSAPEVPRGRRAVQSPAVVPDADELETDEYESAPPPSTLPRRVTTPPAEPPLVTLRDPGVGLGDADEHDPYAAGQARPTQRRRSDPHVKVARAARQSSSRWPAAAKVASRRRHDR